jgi:putative transposase
MPLVAYGALDIVKEEIERGRPWQSNIETHFNIQRRMADWHFARAQNWAELVPGHESWDNAYDHQSPLVVFSETGRVMFGETA